MTSEVITDEDWDQLDRAKHLFYIVRAFVAERIPKMQTVSLGGFCDEILKFRKANEDDLRGRRAFMHVGHYRSAICVWLPAIRKLTTNHQIGLYLHEFGHLGSGRGEDGADLWVKDKLGIDICYAGPLALEWVSAYDGMRVLQADPTFPKRKLRRRT